MTQLRVLLAIALAYGAAAPASAHHPAATASPAGGEAKERGLSTRGLERDARCPHGYLVPLEHGPDRCTHGPDPAPPGVDVRDRRPVAELQAAAATPTAGASVPCHGDGASGDRVQAIYAVASDRPDRYAQIAPLIEGWAADMAARVEQSARETGGFRTIRFVTSSCRLVVSRVVLSPAGDDELGRMVDELRARRYDRADRDYVVWADANVYCGIAYVGWGYARVDSGCFGYAELHELFHNLGAVDTSAPNATRGWHCTDEHDEMCYSDWPDYPAMRYVCPQAYDHLLDCRHDDYFHTGPPSWNYLSARPENNTADSTFLAAEDGAPPVYLPEAPSGYAGPRYRLRIDNSDDDSCAYALRPGSGERVRLYCVGYAGAREVDITGGLVGVTAGRRSVDLRLVATDRGGGRTYGFRLARDGTAVLDDRDGDVGVRSSNAPLGEPDPLIGWPTFYKRTITLSLNAPPAASFTVSPPFPYSGEETRFASTASDPEGAIAEQVWDLDGDGGFDDASGSTATWRFGTAGAHVVRLRVRDDAGATADAARTVNVAARPSGGGGGAPPPPPNPDETSTQSGADESTAWSWGGQSEDLFEHDGPCADAQRRLAGAVRQLARLDRRLDRDYRRLRRWWRRLRASGWPARPSRRYARSLRRFQARQRRQQHLRRTVGRLERLTDRRCQ